MRLLIICPGIVGSLGSHPRHSGFSARDLARLDEVGIDPVGRRFKLGAGDSDTPWFTVVGVVGDIRCQGPEREPIPQTFEPPAQNSSRRVTLLVRMSTDHPLRMVPTIRAAVHRVEKHAPVYGITTLEARLGSFLAQRRFSCFKCRIHRRRPVRTVP